MFVKLYAGMWAVFFLAILIVFAAGSMTMLGWVIAGFVAFTLIFMGMLCVLPSNVGHNAVPAIEKAPKTGPTIRERARATAKAFVEPDGVEMRHPRYP